MRKLFLKARELCLYGILVALELLNVSDIATLQTLELQAEFVSSLHKSRKLSSKSTLLSRQLVKLCLQRLEFIPCVLKRIVAGDVSQSVTTVPSIVLEVSGQCPESTGPQHALDPQPHLLSHVGLR